MRGAPRLALFSLGRIGMPNASIYTTTLGGAKQSTAQHSTWLKDAPMALYMYILFTAAVY